MVSMSFSVNNASLLRLPSNLARKYQETPQWITWIPNIFFLSLFVWLPLSPSLMIRANYPCQRRHLFPCYYWSHDMTNPKWLGSICNLKFNVPWWKQLLPGVRAYKVAGTESTKSTPHFTGSHGSGTTPISTPWILDSGISCVEDWTPHNDHWFRLYTPSWRVTPHSHSVSSPSWPLNYTLPSFYQANYVGQ